MNKKIIFITIVIILISAAILYFAFSGKPASELPIISNLFPETEKTGIENLDTETEKENIIQSRDRALEDLLAISEDPVSSFVLDGQNIYYFDKLNGYLHKTDLNGENKETVSNTTVLNILDAYWGAPGKNAVLKFLDEDENIVFFSAAFNGSNTAGVFLPKNTLSASVSKTENKIAYLIEEKERGLLRAADRENKNIKQIFSFPVSDFRVDLKNNKLFLVSAPSYVYQGILYLLDAKTANNIEKIASGLGLNAAADENGERIFISMSENKQIKNKILNIKDKSEYNITLKTFPEKCAFSALQKEIVYCAVPKIFPNANYPDDWYSGDVSFRDDFYKINYTNGENLILSGENSPSLPFDAKNLILSEDENYLFFINKSDSRLWRIKQNR